MGKSNYKYKKLHPFKWFILQNYPFLEDSIDVLTNYQLFCKLGEMINNQVAPINEMGEQVETLTDSFNELYDYVHDYFDNLDVQDEVDNKLDEMAESGELEEIISQYLQSKIMYCFNTISDMKNSDNLINGSYAQTTGFYSKNDGGSAKYLIREITNQDVVDNAYVIALKNNQLVAELMIDDRINILQLGVPKNDNTFDAHDLILKTSQKGYRLYIPDGNFYTSQLFFDKNCVVDIQGESNCYNNKTFIRPYGDNNGYIIKCGGKENYSVDSTSDYTINELKNIKLNGLTFSDYNNHINKSKYSYNCCLAIDNCSGVELNVKFYMCLCNGLLIRESWEIKSDYLSFRGMYGTFETCGLIFANRVMTSSGSNISALMFNILDFEQINGKCIITERNSNCSNIAVNTITIENARATNPDLLSVKVADITTNEIKTYRTGYNFNPLLGLGGTAISISSINLGSACSCYYYKDGDTTQGKYTDALLDVFGDITISQIVAPSLMLAILTRYYSQIFDCVTITSFATNPGSTQSTTGQKVAQFVYIIPQETSTVGNVCTYVNILDPKIVKNPDFPATFGNGFWTQLDMLKLLLPQKGWQRYVLENDNLYYHVTNPSNTAGIFNNVYIENGKKLRIKVKSKTRVLGVDLVILSLLNADDTVVTTINSGQDVWEVDDWHIVEFTIPSNTTYNHLKLEVKREADIKWIEIE